MIDDGILIAGLLITGAASAETLSLSGTVEAGVTIPVYAPIGGTVAAVSVEAGMHVEKGATLYSYQTEKTYAAEDGKVTGVFAQAGDDAETVSEKYGADLYIVGSTTYTINASTSKAYSAVEPSLNYLVFPPVRWAGFFFCRNKNTAPGKIAPCGTGGIQKGVISALLNENRHDQGILQYW